MLNMTAEKQNAKAALLNKRQTLTPGEDYLCLGAIASAQGIQGEVRVKSFTANPVDVASYGALLGDDGNAYRLKAKYAKDTLVIASIEGVTDRNQAETLRGIKLYARRDALPQLSGKRYYLADLIGMALFDQAGKKVGTINALHNFGAGDVVEVMDESGASDLMLPFSDSVFPEVDVKARRAVVAMPDFVEVAEEEGE